MSAKDKSHYSFLIALAKQIASALEDDGDDNVAIALASLATSLGMLLADGLEDVGDDDDGVPDGIEDLDASGDDVALGDSQQRIADLERRLAAALEQPSKRLLGGEANPCGGVDLARERRDAPILKSAKKGARRRGKK